MQIIDNIPQGSQEWLQLRLGRATASNFSKIVTSTGKRSESLSSYAREIATGLLVDKQEDSYQSPDMIRGNELEDEAREHYEQYTFNSVRQITLFDCGNFSYSPDGLVGDDGLIEIKTPKNTTHTQYLYDDKLPTKYVPQCQGGLMLSGRKWLDFCSYHPDFKKSKLFIKRIFRDEEYIQKLRLGLDEFIIRRDKILNKIGERND
jgi:predicted phage-related endonuclease